VAAYYLPGNRVVHAASGRRGKVRQTATTEYGASLFQVMWDSVPDKAPATMTWAYAYELIRDNGKAWEQTT